MAVPVPRVGAPRTHSRPGPREVILPTLAAFVALVTILSLWRERYEVWALAPALVALAGFLWYSGVWRRQRAVSLALVANLLLVFAYLWSLDESVPVTIQVQGTRVTATVGTDLLNLTAPLHPGRIGLAAGLLGDYHVRPTGEGFDLAQYATNGGAGYLSPTYSLLGRFGQWSRLATPQSAWSGLAVTGSGPVSLGALEPKGEWRQTVRGELEGTPGAALLVGPTLRGSYTIRANLMRGDGTQGILTGIDPAGNGYELAVREDQPDIIWFAWSRNGAGASIAGTNFHLPLVPAIQRDLRLLLGNVMAAFYLVALAPLLYLLLGGLLRLLGGSADEVAQLERFLKRPAVPPILAGVLSVAALVATGLIASNLLQEIPHVQDSVAYLFQARTLALGRLSVPTPRFHTFFTEEFIPMYHGQWFGKYPPGWPLLLAVGVVLHLPWLVDPVLAAADVALLYLVARQVYDAPVALLGSFLLLLSPFFLFLGGSFMAHTSTLFYLLAGTYFLLRWVRGPGGERLLLASGILFGMALMTRQIDAVAYAAPLLLLLCQPDVRHRLPQLRSLVLGGALPVLLLLLYNWRLTGSPLVSPYSLWWPFDHPGFGPTVGIGGNTPARGFWNTGYNLQILLAHLFGWPFYLTLAPAAIPFVLGRARFWDGVWALSVLSIMVAYIFYWAPGVMYGPRYYYVALPGFVLLTARGLQELYWWSLRLPSPLRGDRLAALLVPALLLVALCTYNLSVYLPAQMPVYRGYNFTDASSINAVQRAGLHHALVFVVATDPGAWWVYGAPFSQNSPLLDGDVVYARDQGTGDSSLMRLYPGWEYFRLNGTTLTRL